MSVTLEQYQRAEEELAMTEGRRGLVVHAVVTALVWAAVIPINIVLVPQFPWSAFVVAGTGIGLFFHWFGYRRTRRDMQRHQSQVVRRADTSE